MRLRGITPNQSFKRTAVPPLNSSVRLLRWNRPSQQIFGVPQRVTGAVFFQHGYFHLSFFTVALYPTHSVIQTYSLLLLRCRCSSGASSVQRAHGFTIKSNIGIVFFGPWWFRFSLALSLLARAWHYSVYCTAAAKPNYSSKRTAAPPLNSSVSLL